MRFLRWPPRPRQEQDHFHHKVPCASGGLEQTGTVCGIAHVHEPTAPAASPLCSQMCRAAKRKEQGPEFSRAPFLQYPLLGSERLSRPLSSQSARLCQCYVELRKMGLGWGEEALEASRNLQMACTEFYAAKGRKGLAVPSEA